MSRTSTFNEAGIHEPSTRLTTMEDPSAADTFPEKRTPVEPEEIETCAC